MTDKDKSRGGYSYAWACKGGSATMTPVLGAFNPIGSLYYTTSQSD